MAILSNLQLIRRVALFSSLTDRQADKVASVLVKQRFKRRAIVVEQGKHADTLFIMLNGVARVSMLGESGREIILATLRPGDYIGELSLIDGGPHSATVRAMVLTDILMLHRSDFSALLAESPVFAHAVMLGMAERLRRANQKIAALALLNVHDRVIHTLLDLAAPNLDGEMVIREKISHQDLARMVGASREMVSRVVKELERGGLIQMRDGGTMALSGQLSA